MLMRQKENVNKDSPVGLLLIVTDFSKLERYSSSESKRVVHVRTSTESGYGHQNYTESCTCHFQVVKGVASL